MLQVPAYKATLWLLCSLCHSVLTRRKSCSHTVRHLTTQMDSTNSLTDLQQFCGQESLLRLTKMETNICTQPSNSKNDSAAEALESSISTEVIPTFNMCALSKQLSSTSKKRASETTEQCPLLPPIVPVPSVAQLEKYWKKQKANPNSSTSWRAATPAFNGSTRNGSANSSIVISRTRSPKSTSATSYGNTQFSQHNNRTGQSQLYSSDLVAAANLLGRNGWSISRPYSSHTKTRFDSSTQAFTNRSSSTTCASRTFHYKRKST